jgi:hypothetical protein
MPRRRFGVTVLLRVRAAIDLFDILGKSVVPR